VGLFSSKSKSTTVVNTYTAALDMSQASRSLGIVAQQSTITGGVYYAPIDLNLGSDAINAASSESFRLGKSGMSGNPLAGTLQAIPAQAWTVLAIVAALIIILRK
jgi:hypothetical protein